MDTRIEHDSDQHRFEIYLDGALAGFSEYLPSGGVRTFHHTVTLPQYRGRGLAAILTEHALDDTRQNGMGVMPSCWFVREVIASSGDRYTNLVRPPEQPGGP